MIEFLQNNYLGIIVTGLFTSLISAILFLYILSLLRPKIEISPEISKSISLTNKLKYTVKVINKTRFDVYDIKAQLHIIRKCQTPSGEIEKSELIELKRDDPFILGKFDKKDVNADYAFRFVTYIDLESIWTDDNNDILKFRVICKHQISGVLGYFQQKYRVKKSVIKTGEFKAGNLMEIYNK
ncbi:MAG: hypothetical protein PHR83_05215 [Paludibacter sp.]|nr:hypothetical protein [Paludibacter sp.]